VAFLNILVIEILWQTYLFSFKYSKKIKHFYIYVLSFPISFPTRTPIFEIHNNPFEIRSAGKSLPATLVPVNQNNTTDEINISYYGHPE
jgi:hypothetical protein